eukprot:INCI1802.2.p1 GENE.INCI1802.2~~INCI1802.2.p1  ORF type:complete len:206 (+),score=37.63 INCI1802.2:216-833(+)
MLCRLRSQCPRVASIFVRVQRLSASTEGIPGPNHSEPAYAGDKDTREIFKVTSSPSSSAGEKAPLSESRPRLAALREKLRSQTVPRLRAAKANRGRSSGGDAPLGRRPADAARRELPPDYRVNMNPSALKARSLYREIIRASKAMPTINRRDFIRARARREFDLATGETDPEKIDFHLRFAETQLESIKVQAQHLTELDKMQPVW